MISWKCFLEKVIEDFKDKGYNFNHIPDMHIMTIANKRNMSYEVYLKHNMGAIEWRINAMINKTENFIKKFARN